MSVEFENGPVMNFVVLLAGVKKFCRQNLETIPGSCRWGAKNETFLCRFQILPVLGKRGLKISKVSFKRKVLKLLSFILPYLNGISGPSSRQSNVEIVTCYLDMPEKEIN